MWLLGGAGGDSEDVVHTEELKAETDELQAKLNALRSAPGSALMEALSQEQRETVRDTRFGSATETAVHYDLADDAHESPGKSDLVDMYDFSGFKTTSESLHATSSSASAREPIQKPLSKKAQLRAERQAELERLQALEKTLRRQNEELEIQMEQQERKLTAATRSVAKTRKQAAKLTAQAGLQDIKGSKNSKEVEQLRVLLAERESQLQDALDECDTALSVNTRTGNVGDDEAQQLQAAPAAVVSQEDEESLQQLLRITEELTDALETSRAGEEELRRELDIKLAELAREEARASECRRRMDEAKEAKDAEVSLLLVRLKEKEQALAAERARCIALEVGAAPPKVDNRGVEPEGEPAGKESLDLLPKVDRSDPEVEAAERAALAAVEAMKLHGSAARAGATAAKVAGHLTNIANGGLLRKLPGIRVQVQRTVPPPSKGAKLTSGGLSIPKAQISPVPGISEDPKVVASTSTGRNADWNLEPIEV